MYRGSLLHLNLKTAVLRIYVVELLGSAGTHITFLLRIEELIKVEQLTAAMQEQTESIPCGVGIMLLLLLDVRTQQAGADKNELAEVEVIANGALLIIDGRAAAQLLFSVNLYLLIPVRINQYGRRLANYALHTRKGILPKRKRRWL